jgi:hypothetical protein
MGFLFAAQDQCAHEDPACSALGALLEVLAYQSVPDPATLLFSQDHGISLASALREPWPAMLQQGFQERTTLDLLVYQRQLCLATDEGFRR